MYLWQAEQWPNFHYQWQALEPSLSQLDDLQARLLQRVEALPAMEKAALEHQHLVEHIQATLAMGDELVDQQALTAAAAAHLGLPVHSAHKANARSNQLVQTFGMRGAQLNLSLSHYLLNQWHHILLRGHTLTEDIDLRGPAELQLVQINEGKPQVFYKAPPRAILEDELASFYRYYNQAVSKQGHGFIKAGICYLWLLTLQPFDEGNVSLALLLVDRLLAKTHQQSSRFYNLASTLLQQQPAHYAALQKTQKRLSASQQVGGAMDVTQWLNTFLGWLAEAMQATLKQFDHIALKQRFWQQHAQTLLSQRQVNVLNHLLLLVDNQDGKTISARQYMQLTGVSKATATRDLTDLLRKNCISRLSAGGRSTEYRILSLL